MQSTITPSSALSPASTYVAFVAQSAAHGCHSPAPRKNDEPHAVNPIVNPIAIIHHLAMTAVCSTHAGARNRALTRFHPECEPTPRLPAPIWRRPLTAP